MYVPGRERQISYDIAYMWNLKTWYKTEIESQMLKKKKFMVT